MAENSERDEVTDAIVAWLHCELPMGGAAVGRTPSASGTADFGEADGGGPTARETITLYASHALRIGRAKANDLVVEHPGISRFHCVFSGSLTGVVLSDLASLNGTFLNGRRISSPVDVISGDIVTLGNVRMTVELSRGVEQPREPKAISDMSASSTHAAKMATTQVTVLVADVCGFTALSQAVPPTELVEMLNRWFSRISTAILEERGEIDKYIGDCVMALWRGDSLTIRDQTVRAVKAAQRIIDETSALAATGVWKHQDRFPWNCRVALNTGEALVGAVGKSGASDYTVLGDTVNVAFRLESLASTEGSALVLSKSTADCVDDLLPLQSLGEVILEGRKENLEIFTVVRDR